MPYYWYSIFKSLAKQLWQREANTKQRPTKFNDRKYIMVMGNPAWKLISWCLWSGWGVKQQILESLCQWPATRILVQFSNIGLVWPRMINYDKDSPLSECMREARHPHRRTGTHFPGHPRIVSSGNQLSQMSFPVGDGTVLWCSWYYG